MTALDRSRQFCDRFGISRPILLAPMAGACPPSLSIAVGDAGGMGGCGALLMTPAQIRDWAATVRAATAAPFQINLWIPEPPPVRDEARERAVRTFLATWGADVPPEAGRASLQDFDAQCDAVIDVAPRAASSIMGLFPPAVVARLKARGIAWFATATTVDEARRAEAAGADVIVAQGMEAGGHRGAFDAAAAERTLVGLLSLVPAVVDAVRIPVVAAGGIADGRGVAAALALGAAAALIGTGFLRAPEAQTPAAWADALGRTAPEQTLVTRAFSGRPGRCIATAYARAATDSSAPDPAPYPVQRGLTATMRATAVREGDLDRMQAWAGQSAALARAESAGEITRRLWDDAHTLLR
jgi:nitronate monooxygenase